MVKRSYIEYEMGTQVSSPASIPHSRHISNTLPSKSAEASSVPCSVKA
jgi:hypothetical protein